MWTFKYVLALLVIAGCGWAQTLPQFGESAKPLLDLTFPRNLPPKRAVPQNRFYKPQFGEPAKPLLDLTFLRKLLPSQPAPQNTFFKPAGRQPWQLTATRQRMDVDNISALGPCSVPLIEAQISKQGLPAIRKVVPPLEQMGPIRQMRPPAPSCEAANP